MPRKPKPPPKPERRKRGSGTIRVLREGVVQAQVRIKGVKGRPTETFHAATTDAAKALAEQWIARQHARGASSVQSSAATVDQLAENWLATLPPDTPYGSLEAYTYYRKLLGPLGARPADQLRGDEVQRWLNDLGKRLSATTVRGARSWLSVVYRDSIAWRLATENPVRATRPPRMVPVHRAALTREQARAFLRLTRGDELELFWRVLLETGCRQGEARGLRWADVDWERGVLAVSGTAGDKTRERVDATKTLRPRRLRLSAGLLAALRAHRREHPDSLYVFTNARGQVLSGPEVRYRLRRLLRKLPSEPAEAWPKISPHGLRHTNARVALLSGATLKHVQARLGHKRFNITADLYGEFSAEELDEAAEIIAAALEGPEVQKPGEKRAEGSENGSGESSS